MPSSFSRLLPQTEAFLVAGERVWGSLYNYGLTGAKAIVAFASSGSLSDFSSAPWHGVPRVRRDRHPAPASKCSLSRHIIDSERGAQSGL